MEKRLLYYLKGGGFLEPTWTNCRKSIKLVHKCIFWRSTLLIVRIIFPGKQKSFLSVELAEVYRPKQRYSKSVVILFPSTEIQPWNVCYGRYAWAGEEVVCVYVRVYKNITVNTLNYICIAIQIHTVRQGEHSWGFSKFIL